MTLEELDLMPEVEQPTESKSFLIQWWEEKKLYILKELNELVFLIWNILLSGLVFLVSAGVSLIGTVLSWGMVYQKFNVWFFQGQEPAKANVWSLVYTFILIPALLYLIWCISEEVMDLALCGGCGGCGKKLPFKEEPCSVCDGKGARRITAGNLLAGAGAGEDERLVFQIILWIGIMLPLFILMLGKMFLLLYLVVEWFQYNKPMLADLINHHYEHAQRLSIIVVAFFS